MSRPTGAAPTSLRSEPDQSLPALYHPPDERIDPTREPLPPRQPRLRRSLSPVRRHAVPLSPIPRLRRRPLRLRSNSASSTMRSSSTRRTTLLRARQSIAGPRYSPAPLFDARLRRRGVRSSTCGVEPSRFEFGSALPVGGVLCADPLAQDCQLPFESFDSESQRICPIPQVDIVLTQHDFLLLLRRAPAVESTATRPAPARAWPHSGVSVSVSTG